MTTGERDLHDLLWERLREAVGASRLGALHTARLTALQGDQRPFALTLEQLGTALLHPDEMAFLLEMMRERDLETCDQCGGPGLLDRPCPYRTAIAEDGKTTCRCCGQCEGRCTRDAAQVQRTMRW